jgi:hypothetical protein
MQTVQILQQFNKLSSKEQADFLRIATEDFQHRPDTLIVVLCQKCGDLVQTERPFFTKRILTNSNAVLVVRPIELCDCNHTSQDADDITRRLQWYTDSENQNPIK